MAILNGIFSNKGPVYFTFEYKQFYTKIDQISFIVKQPNASMIGISEPRVNSSILQNNQTLRWLYLMNQK